MIIHKEHLNEKKYSKLNHKMIDSFKILKVLESACQLKLLSFMKIHNIFHISLLRSDSNDSVQRQISSKTSSIVMNDEDEWELNDILNARKFRNKIQFKTKWRNHSSDNTWYPTDNFNNAKEIVDEFYRQYSNKSR